MRHPWLHESTMCPILNRNTSRNDKNLKAVLSNVVPITATGMASRWAIPAAARSACVGKPADAGGLHHGRPPNEPTSPGERFSHVAAGKITTEIDQRYALDDAVRPHRGLESGPASARRSSAADHEFDQTYTVLADVLSENPTKGTPHDD